MQAYIIEVEVCEPFTAAYSVAQKQLRILIPEAASLAIWLVGDHIHLANQREGVEYTTISEITLPQATVDYFTQLQRKQEFARTVAQKLLPVLQPT